MADCLSRNPVDSPDSAKELEDKWVVASAVEDPPELSRMEEYRWVAAKALVDRQAVSEVRDQKAAKAAPAAHEEDDPVQ